MSITYIVQKPVINGVDIVCIPTFFGTWMDTFFCCVQDLEQYASSYSGLMRIERLQFIADHCPQLRVEALKMALSFVQRTFNVDVYEEIHRKLTEATRQFQFHL